jgi:hypothetical protein
MKMAAIINESNEIWRKMKNHRKAWRKYRRRNQLLAMVISAGENESEIYKQAWREAAADENKQRVSAA